MKVMGREEDGFTGLPRQLMEQVENFVFSVHIQEGGGFVQQDEGSILGDGSGDHCSLAFPVA